MNKKIMQLLFSGPYRLFFPVGILCLLAGVSLWIPQIWTADYYPVLIHRYLMLNGFVASFVGGFLMTAVPKFSKTFSARGPEILLFLLVTLSGIVFASNDHQEWVSLVSAFQAAILLYFLFVRIFKRQENPPYSFIFIFIGMGLWLISGVLGFFLESDLFKRLHYEAAITAIIIGVGSRLIPGILGHSEIVMAQRQRYEKPVPLLTTVPVFFFLLMFGFLISYLLDAQIGSIIRAIIVGFIAFKYWVIWKAPKEKTALTWNIWLSAWLILVSFIIRAVWEEGAIHGGHFFFINGIVYLSLLIATRVLQSHGPKNKQLENSRILFGVSFFVVLAAFTRVSAFLLPEFYLTHLGHSALILIAGVLLWSWKYLRYIVTEV